jgi:hypothetical protein
MTKCYVCRRHVEKSDAIYINPVNARIAKTGVAFCSECVPPQ